MSNVKKWVDAISNEDGEKLSLGSHRTLKLIAEQYDRMNTKREDYMQAITKILNYAQDCSLDNVSQMSEALKWIIEEGEAALTTK